MTIEDFLAAASRCGTHTLNPVDLEPVTRFVWRLIPPLVHESADDPAIGLREDHWQQFKYLAGSVVGGNADLAEHVQRVAWTHAILQAAFSDTIPQVVPEPAESADDEPIREVSPTVAADGSTDLPELP